VNRRDVLGTLGMASASTLLWAFGCRAPERGVKTIATSGGEIRTWLHDAVAVLAGAGLESPRALAVTRKRATAAIDVLGPGISRGRYEGVVLSAKTREGTRREQVTNELTAAGIAAAAKALAGGSTRGKVELGEPKTYLAEYVDPDDKILLDRVEAIGRSDRELTSRIVYQAALLDIDDATVWAIAPGRDLQQRLVRVRRAATRVAWNGTRPVVGEISRAWIGALDDHELDPQELSDVTRSVQTLTTPGAFDEGEYAIVLAPEVVARIADVATRALLTTSAARRPDVERRLVLGKQIAAPVLTLVDDPTVDGAYGGFHFDDEGEAAVPVALINEGHLAARLPERRRPGHVGALEASASHLRITPGGSDAKRLLDAGYSLDGPMRATVDPGSDRVVVAVSRARELRGGERTGRVFADIELVGELTPLLAQVSAVSKEAVQVAVREEVDGLPRWRSIDAPWLRTRGRLRARRSQT